MYQIQGKGKGKIKHHTMEYLSESAPVSPTPEESKPRVTDSSAPVAEPVTPGGTTQVLSGDEADVQMTPGISTSLPEKEPSTWTEVKRRHRTPTSNKTGKVS